MARSENQKLKILYVLKILWEKTDGETSISMPQLLSELEKYGIHAERKSVYGDIEALREFGFDIASGRGGLSGYALTGRGFELPELKLLVDAVQSSKFITYKKSMELIEKLGTQCSEAQRRTLRRQLFIRDRVKTMNESIYYNVDELHAAIAENREIAFKYYEYNMKKEMVLRRDGQDYVVSPFALTWDDENYYLIAYDAQADILKHYRVDKMARIRLLESERRGIERFRELNLARYAKRVFGMFGGSTEQVRLRFSSNLAGVVIDRFGEDIMLVPDGDDAFTATLEVDVSPQFMAWVFGLGEGVRILYPQRVADEFRGMAERIAENYR